MLSFTFLGTSSGVPTQSRNVSGIAVSTNLNKKWILIDAGEGTQHQLQKAKFSLQDLTTVCITHVHGDHCYGLLGLLASAGMGARSEPLTLIAPQEIWEWFQASARLTDLHLPYPIHFIESRTLNQPFALFEGVSIQTHALHHRVPCHAFDITVQRQTAKLDTTLLDSLAIPKGELWGKLQRGISIEWNGQTIHSEAVLQYQHQQVRAIIAGDNDQPELLLQACQHADVLIHEATYTQAILDKVGSGPMHSSAKMVAEFAQMAQLPNLLLMHFSPRYHTDTGLAALQQEASAYYQGTLFLANDFDVYTLHADKKLMLMSA
jgi:ribonuclease Z